MKKERGITLIALVITIIVMMILVAVSVTVALNGGLFKTAEQAANETGVEKDREHNLSKGEITIKGETYTSYDEYAGTQGTLKEGWTEVAEEERTEGWSENVIEMRENATKKTIPLPKGFMISTVETEDSIEEGLVIKDSNNNEFVWIPVEDGESFVNIYENGSYLEPTELTSTKYSASGYAYDSQETLDYLYGKDYYDYDVDFAYSEHYEEMVASVNKYDGFYVGRYETTIDDAGNIGSKNNTTVLRAATILKEGTNSNNNDEYYRWYGLYYAQRNTDSIVGNGSIVQSNMIWGQQWDAMMDFLGETQASSKISGSQSPVLKSGEATYDNGLKDVMNNIYDLRRNGKEWIAEANSTNGRIGRGGYYAGSSSYIPASARSWSETPVTISSDISSRLALYIK